MLQLVCIEAMHLRLRFIRHILSLNEINFVVYMLSCLNELFILLNDKFVF